MSVSVLWCTKRFQNGFPWTRTRYAEGLERVQTHDTVYYFKLDLSNQCLGPILTMHDCFGDKRFVKKKIIIIITKACKPKFTEEAQAAAADATKTAKLSLKASKPNQHTSFALAWTHDK